jgi:3'-5' exoribonuclease
MCCLCFERFDQDQLNIAESGQKEDVCLKCAEAEKNTPTTVPKPKKPTTLVREILRKYMTAADTAVILGITSYVLRDDRLTYYPGSVPDKDGKPKHHGEDGGLLRHTLEVLSFSLAAASAYPDRVDMKVLAVGALVHDAGKLREYGRGRGAPWVRKTPDIPHLVHSLMMWEEWCSGAPQHDEVTHLIASHHGRREWGSPCVPGNLEACILHSADIMSVMLDGNINPAARP